MPIESALTPRGYFVQPISSSSGSAFVRGSPVVGQTLTAAGNAAFTGVQWTRAAATPNAVPADISGATSSTYVLQSADLGNVIGFRTTSPAYAAPGVLVADTPPAAAISTLPVIVSANVGEALVWTQGTGVGTITYSIWRNGVRVGPLSQGQRFTAYQLGDRLIIGMRVSDGFGNVVRDVSSAFQASNGTPPVANFTASATSGQIPLSVTFTDTSTGAPTEWEWEFFGGGLVQSTLKSPGYTFREPGTYTVKMRAKNGAGQSEVVKTALITVTDKTYAARAASISRWTEGTEDVLYTPNSERLLAAEGATLLDFTSVTPTTLTACTTDTYTPTRYAPRSQSRRLIAAAGGNFSAVFPVAAQPTYDATKSMVAKFWVSDFDSVNGFSIKIDNGSFNSQSWQFSGTGLKRGWNTMVLAAPNDAVAVSGIAAVAGLTNKDGYSSVQSGTATLGGGVSWVSTAQGATPGMQGLPVKNVTVSILGSSTQLPSGFFLCLDSIDIASRVKPVLSLTFDQTNEIDTDGVFIFSKIRTLMKKYGLIGDARIHQQVTSYQTPAALADGWGYNNGTLTRKSPLTGQGADALSEYGGINDLVTAYGGLSLPDFGAMPGHNTNMDYSWGVAALQQLGAPKFMRGNAQRPIYHGTAGHNTRGNTFGNFGIDFEQTNPDFAKAYIDGMISFGGYGCLFSHTAAWSTARAAYLETIFAYIRQKVDAGQMDCLPLSANGTQRSMARAFLGYI